MMIYLIRHADATDAADDRVRSLSALGHRQVGQLAAFLRANDALRGVTAFWHSPLVRARETAERLATGLSKRIPLSEVSGLQPEDSPRLMLAQLAQLKASVAIVGHEPHLSALATLLVSPRSESLLFVFQKGTVLALEKSLAKWYVRWQIAPELLGDHGVPRRSAG